MTAHLKKPRNSSPSRRSVIGSFFFPPLLLGLCVPLVLGGCMLLVSSDAKRGDQHLSERNWEEAILAYRQALKDDPFDSGLQKKYALARERAAAAHEERGRALLKERQVEAAVEEFKRAISIEPSNPDYQAGLTETLRLKDAREQAKEADKLAQLGRSEDALHTYTKAAELDPTLNEALEGIAKLSEEQQAQARDERQGQPVTLRFRNAGLKEVLEGLAKAGGLNLIFDKDVRNDPVSISIEDTPFDEALNLILNSNNLFARKVSADLLIISPNTKQKQEQYQDLMVRTFYLSTAKAKDMLALLKGMLDSKRMHANEQLNTIVIRDQPEKLQMAERIILANDRPESEVLFDVEVLEVDRTVDQTYGLSYPKQIAGAIVPPGFAGTISGDLAQQLNLQQLTTLGKSNYLFKLPTNIQLDFFKQTTDAKTLAAPKVRVVNNKKAEINIGDKQPILLSTTNVLPGQGTSGAIPVTSTVTSIEFRDTGVKLTVEPSIHLGNELALKMKIEVVRLGEQVVLQASPLITQFKFGNRSAETMLNVRDGETIVLGGLLQEEDRRTRQSIPWLGDLPVIGNLLSSFKTQRITSEVILTITPHIVQGMTPPGLENQAFWSGTEFLYGTTPMFTSQARKTSGPAGPLRTAALLTGQAGLARTGSNESAVALKAKSPKESTKLSIRPSELAAESGKEFSIELTVAQLQSLREGTLRLDYDPQILEFRKVTNGQLLKQGDPAASLTATTNQDVGAIDLKMKRHASPIGGDGELARVVFSAKAPGVSPLRVELSRQPGYGGFYGPPQPGTAIVRVR